MKVEGIGLYRTEFPFLVRSSFPSEEEQYIIYKKLTNIMHDKEITFRTLDIGGDKIISYYDYGTEKNPFLGMRSIRFSLRHKDVFVAQIRAILRAGAEAKLKIMFPMISSLDELLEAKRLVHESMSNLCKENIPYNRDPKIGMMVELPAVLEIIDELSQEADFFSIGTNDFIQYMLAVDRGNEKIAHLYQPGHPSVLRALKKVVDAAKNNRIGVSICGDMVHEPKYIPYLLGIGIREFSLDVRRLPKIQDHIRNIDLAVAVERTKNILRRKTVCDVEFDLKENEPVFNGRKKS
jgi:phosphotransferase system enzyme I (PtsP)